MILGERLKKRAIKTRIRKSAKGHALISESEIEEIVQLEAELEMLRTYRDEMEKLYKLRKNEAEQLEAKNERLKLKLKDKEQAINNLEFCVDALKEKKAS